MLARLSYDERTDIRYKIRV